MGRQPLGNVGLLSSTGAISQRRHGTVEWHSTTEMTGTHRQCSNRPNSSSVLQQISQWASPFTAGVSWLSRPDQLIRLQTTSTWDGLQQTKCSNREVYVERTVTVQCRSETKKLDVAIPLRILQLQDAPSTRKVRPTVGWYSFLYISPFWTK